MILLDLNQVMIANLMVQLKNHQNAELSESMLRHMILNSIRKNRKKFKRQYGELVICADDRNYWRKQNFPYYKAKRKTDREQSEIDWNTVFTALNNVRSELKEYMPYKVIHIEGAEADDSIGTIVHEMGKPIGGDPILILSGDKDYIQLHVYPNVKQYDPTRDKWISHDDPEQYLFEHILKGDAGDGIPNIMTRDDFFVTKEKGDRQKPITAKRIAEWSDLNNLDSDLKKRYERNRSLIDLTLVPDHIKQDTLNMLHDDTRNPRSKIMEYFSEKRLRNLLENIAEF